MSVLFFKTLSMSNEQVGAYTSLLYFPWTFKLFWAPLVDLYATRRTWIIATQAALAIVSAMLTFAVFIPNNTNILLFLFALMAFASSTQDVSIDGYYLDVLNNEQQALYVGIRNSAYKMAWLFGSGALVYLAGSIAQRDTTTNSTLVGWSTAFAVCTGIFTICSLMHSKILPVVEENISQSVDHESAPVNAPDNIPNDTLEDAQIDAVHETPAIKSHSNSKKVTTAAATEVNKEAKAELQDFLKSFPIIFKDFWNQPRIEVIILYVLIFRLGDALLMKMAQPFLVDPIAKGGLGLSVADVGTIYGVVGTFFLLAGGMLGSALISKGGLNRYIMPFAIIQNLSLLLYWFLAIHKPNIILVACVNAFEQFSYGLGTSSYTVLLLSTVKPGYKASQYAIVTAFMALGVMFPGYVSGFLTTQLGYANFFLFSFFVSLPGIITIPYLPLKQLAAQRTQA
jgi:PAT family beta-lactamase induction signal transducer AmpG